MYDRAKPTSINKSWKIEILMNEIDSLNTTLSTPKFYNPEDKEILIELMYFTKTWLAELEGKAQPKLSKNNIDQKINFIDSSIKMWSQILDFEKNLPDEDRFGIEDDIKKFKAWKAELKALRVSK